MMKCLCANNSLRKLSVRLRKNYRISSNKIPRRILQHRWQIPPRLVLETQRAFETRIVLEAVAKVSIWGRRNSEKNWSPTVS